MMISKKSAMQIVIEVRKIVNQHINLMNEKGIIIASTDISRIGQFHFVAKKIIDECLDELYVETDMETDFMKKGLNLPIYNQKKIVGVIGITGEYNQVYKVGQIVRRMTEILILDADYQWEKAIQIKMTNRFLDQWLRGSCNLKAPEFIEKGLELGINVLKSKRIIVLSLELPQSEEDIRLLDEKAEDSNSSISRLVEDRLDVVNSSISRIVEEKIERANTSINRIIENQGNSLVFKTRNKTICILQEMSQNKIQKIIDKIVVKVNDQQLELKIGVDSSMKVNNDIRQKYNYAIKAWNSTTKKENIKFYDDVTMEIFLTDIKLENKEEYIKKLFKDSSEDELKEWLIFLEIYFNHNGSIAKASNEMYIHKNTLQYKLKKLHSLTGYDVRILSEATVMYMALIFLRNKFCEIE